MDVNESNMRWIQDFRMKSYANPAKLESIDGKVFAVGCCVISIYEGNMLLCVRSLEDTEKA